MKLVDYDNPLLEILLPNDMLWSDEFEWTPVTTSKSWSINGAMIIQKSTMQTGRPITLKAPGADMAWIYRDVLEELYSWSNSPTKKMRLYLEKPDDTRDFIVIFGDGNNPIKAQPVKGWADHKEDDPYQVEIRLIVA